MLPFLKGRTDDYVTGDFLKLDNDVSLSKSGLKVETVFFDKSTGGVRSKNLLTVIFGRLMEWRAKNWIRKYVEKNKDYLPGSEIFLKNINSSDGVKRSDIISLLAKAKIARSPIFSMPEKNTTGLKMNYLFKDAGENVIDFFVKSIKPAPSRDAVKVFLNFVEKGSSEINYANVGDALDFLDNFREWSEKNPDENLVTMIKGNVNLFRSSVKNKITDFNQIDKPLVQNEKDKYIKLAKTKENIKDAFQVVLESENKDKLLFNEFLGSRGNVSSLDFLSYVRNGACAINFSNIKKLEAWADDGMKKFIDNLSLDNQYLIPSLQVVGNQLKMDIKEFRGESYKVAVDRPAFLSSKISVNSDDDAW